MKRLIGLFLIITMLFSNFVYAFSEKEKNSNNILDYEKNSNIEQDENISNSALNLYENNSFEDEQNLYKENDYFQEEMISSSSLNIADSSIKIEDTITSNESIELLNENITLAANESYIWPLDMANSSVRISSPYGYRWGTLHKGIDISAPLGTPIYASKSGTVVVSLFGTPGSGYNDYGYTVVIEHDDGLYTQYSHCSKLEVNKGDYVNQGQLIARVGNTGFSTGNHCHFEIKTSAKFCQIDPTPYLDGTIQTDEEVPEISNIGVKNIDNNGYTVYCKATDNVGIDRVVFFAKSVNSNDWIEHNDVYKDGDFYYCDIKVSSLGNKETNYNNCVHVLDTSGNLNMASINDVYIDKTKPVISNVKVKKDSTGYTISCTVTDNNHVNRVQFPTWTSKNEQDDIISDWTTNSKASGTKNGNTYTYRVNYSNHNNEQGFYNTHIYAFDDHNNSEGNPQGSGGNYYKYTISYNSNGSGVSGIPNNQSKVHDIDLKLSTNMPTRNGYLFLGWSTSSSSTRGEYVAGSIYQKNSNVTLYAIWKKVNTTTAYCKGDLNGDGRISISDLSMMQKAIIELITLNSIQRNAADLNGDGKVSISDLSKLKKYLIGLITSF